MSISEPPSLNLPATGELAISTRDTNQTGGSSVLPVSEVIAILREWVNRHASHFPEFAGAYLWGGITAMPPDAPFHLYRDVDVVVVYNTDAPDDEGEEFYLGLMIEIIGKNLDEHTDIEAILANPSAGPNLATTQILADPTGILEPLQKAVSAGYARRRWIMARCESEKASAEKSLAAMWEAKTPEDRMNSVREFLMALSGLMAVADLKRPTTRRTLTLLRELLDAQGRPDLHEKALALMGSASMSREDVQVLHGQIVSAFDRAAEVNRTPVPYGFAIRPHLRPYYVEATLEMIEEGNHREAVFWISCLETSYHVLRNDAPDAEKLGFEAQFRALQDALGLTSDEGWAGKLAIAEKLLPEIDQLAGALAARHPE